MNARLRLVLTNLAAYALAGAIIWYLARGVPIRSIGADWARANVALFLIASVLGFAIWFFGETLLFSRLFSYVHDKPTGFGELIPANAACYFLQLVNFVVAGGPFVLFLNRRKKVPLIAAGWTLIFQTMIDGSVLAAMTIAFALAYPRSPIRGWLWYATGALAVLIAIAVFWIRGAALTGLGRWILERPSMEAFRNARAAHYVRLASIRIAIFSLAGVVLYFQMRAFGLAARLGDVMAFNPVVILLGGLPITPAGIGPYQAVVVAGFSGSGSKAQLLAMSLAVTTISIVFRAAIGLVSMGFFASEMAGVGTIKSMEAESADPVQLPVFESSRSG